MKFRLKGGWGLHWYGELGNHDHGRILADDRRSSHERVGLFGQSDDDDGASAKGCQWTEQTSQNRLVEEQEQVGTSHSRGRGRKRESGMPKPVTLKKTASFRTPLTKMANGSTSKISESRQSLLATRGSEERFADADEPNTPESRILRHIDDSMAQLEARLDAKMGLHMDNLRALVQTDSPQEAGASKRAPTGPQCQRQSANARLQTLPTTAPHDNMASLKKVPLATHTTICAYPVA